MTDTQSTPVEEAAKDDKQARFLRSLIPVFKDNRDVLPSLLEMLECLIANEGNVPNLIEASIVEEYRSSKEKELMIKLETAEKQQKLLELEIVILKADLEEKEKELFSTKEKEILNKGKEVSKKMKENEKKIDLLKTESETKEKETSKAQKEISKKEREISKKEKELVEREKKLSETLKQNEEKLSAKDVEMKKMFDKYSKHLEQHKTRNDSLRRELEAKDGRIQQYSESLSKMTDELNTAYTKMDSYKSRLASLSEKRVKQDQRLVEDTLASNRQSELEKDFSAFFDDDRMDVCEKIQSIYQNKEDHFVFIYYPRLACIILETAYEQAKEVKAAAIDLFKELTKIMIDYAAIIGQQFSAQRKLHKDGKYSGDFWHVPFNVAIWGDVPGYPKDVTDGMTLSLKETAQICNLDSLVEDVLNAVYIKWNQWCEEDTSCVFSPAPHLLRQLDKYIKACIRLTWRMVTQVPPMKLEYECSKFNKNIHEKMGYHCSLEERTRAQSSAEQGEEEEIACYLWPGLLDAGGRLIRAGEVLCKVKEQDSARTARYH